MVKLKCENCKLKLNLIARYIRPTAYGRPAEKLTLNAYYEVKQLYFRSNKGWVQIRNDEDKLSQYSIDNFEIKERPNLLIVPLRGK